MSRRSKNRKRMDWSKPEFWQSPAYNSILFNSFRDRMISMAMICEKWVNLPATCNERYLEQSLLFEGQATIAFPRSRPGIFYSTKAVWAGRPNVYDEPTKWRSFGNGGWLFPVNHTNGVFIYDNNTRYPLMTHIDIWARELTDLMTTKQMNRVHQRIPFVLKGAVEKEFDMINIIKQVMGGELAIILTDTSDDIIKTEVFQTGVQYLGNELQAEIRNIWNEFYACVGINNLPFKSERQIEDEVNSQEEPAMLSGLGRTSCRREGAKKLNSRFEMYLDDPIGVVRNVDFKSKNFSFAHDLGSKIEYGSETANLITALGEQSDVSN